MKPPGPSTIFAVLFALTIGAFVTENLLYFPLRAPYMKDPGGRSTPFEHAAWATLQTLAAVVFARRSGGGRSSQAAVPAAAMVRWQSARGTRFATGDCPPRPWPPALPFGAALGRRDAALTEVGGFPPAAGSAARRRRHGRRGACRSW